MDKYSVLNKLKILLCYEDTKIVYLFVLDDTTQPATENKDTLNNLLLQRLNDEKENTFRKKVTMLLCLKCGKTTRRIGAHIWHEHIRQPLLQCKICSFHIFEIG